VAQLGARFHGMEEVVGSIPTRSTKSPNLFGAHRKGFHRIALGFHANVPALLQHSTVYTPAIVIVNDRRGRCSSQPRLTLSQNEASVSWLFAAVGAVGFVAVKMVNNSMQGKLTRRNMGYTPNPARKIRWQRLDESLAVVHLRRTRYKSAHAACPLTDVSTICCKDHARY
jgi:hypothetical protein